MANMKFLGIPNVFAQPAFRATAESQASSSMADSNLLTEEPSEFWRSSDNRPEMCVFRVDVRSGNTIALNSVGIAGHNLWNLTGKYRIILASSTAALPGQYGEAVLPNAIAASTNATGAVTDVDEGFTVDSNWMTPTTAFSPWSVRFQFATPSDTPKTGTDRQAFWIYAKCNASVLSLAEAPTIKVSLYESGSLVAVLQQKAINSTTGQWLCFPWNASQLGTASGANVEALCEFTLEGSSSQWASLGAIVWHSETPTSQPTATVIHDSGWVSPGQYIGDPNSSVEYVDLSLAYNSFLHTFGSTHSGVEQTYFLFREDHAPNLLVYEPEALNQIPFGYVEAGTVVGGIEFSPSENMQWGDIFAVDHLSTEARSDGGQEFGSNRGTLRAASLDFAYLTQDEAAFVMDRLVRRKSTLGPVLISILPNDDEEEEMTTFYATLAGQRTVYNLHPAEGAGRRLVLDFTEKV